VAGERSADEIQRDIENARVSLATAIDQLAFRTNPKRLTDNVKHAVIEKIQSPQGKAVIGATGALVGILIIRRIVKHRR
jgi:Protein of unknown function (DUF3618)